MLAYWADGVDMAGISGLLAAAFVSTFWLGCYAETDAGFQIEVEICVVSETAGVEESDVVCGVLDAID